MATNTTEAKKNKKIRKMKTADIEAKLEKLRITIKRVDEKDSTETPPKKIQGKGDESLSLYAKHLRQELEVRRGL